MSDLSLDIAQFLAKSRSLPVIDVRSPSEFEHAHIPGAVNLPLFSNEERSVIGTLYLQKGTSEAMTKGLEFIGPKLKEFAEAGHRISSGGELLMHCWRGGMRSNSMAWLMNTTGIKTYTLTGGYKRFRQYVLSGFKKPFNLVIIGGMTGSGKTAVIEAMHTLGQQTIHLEQLARHRGSVFGAIGLPAQPSTEQFENELFRQLMNLDDQKPVFIEDESMAIGQVFMPIDFYQHMNAAPIIELVVPKERRVDRLVSIYAQNNTDELIAGVKRIERRLGLETAKTIARHIQNNEMSEAAFLILNYYDKVYHRSMSRHKRKLSVEIQTGDRPPAEIAEMIIHKVNNSYE